MAIDAFSDRDAGDDELFVLTCTMERRAGAGEHQPPYLYRRADMMHTSH